MRRLLGNFAAVVCVSACLGFAVSRAEGSAARSWLDDGPGQGSPESLRAAAEDLAAVFGAEYPDSQKILAELSAIEMDLASAKAGGGGGRDEVYERFVSLQRRALFANPLVSDDAIVFVVRDQYEKDHHNTATLFQTDEINTEKFEGPGALKVMRLGGKGGAKSGQWRVRTLLEAADGVIRDPEVSFDGRKIVFSMRRDIEDDYHIYEIDADGGDLKQLTFGGGVSDIDPVYLPDGGIVFSSTREPKYCMCNRHIMANLFRMDADGANIHQIGKSTLFEGHSSVLADGRILYDRWEYVDRNFGDAQALWTVRPDGTSPSIYWGNNTWSPGGVIDARGIGDTGKAVCIFTSCHDRPWGAMAIIDRRLGMDGAEPVVRIWPADAAGLMDVPEQRQEGTYGFDRFKQVMPKYEDPYPLSDKYFLVSRSTGEGELDSKGQGTLEMGIFLVDVFGNEVLIHAEGPGCYDPVPLRARRSSSPIPPSRDFDNGDGYFYITDVYRGTHMKGVNRGDVRFLRVVESPEKRNWTNPAWKGQGAMAPAMNWHDFNNKRILGTVPVESDGSAYFAVPGERFVYFQLLDKDGMMIQSMRSGTLVQSGETAGCIGCHDDRRSAAAPAAMVSAASAEAGASGETSLALRRAASWLDGWYGKERLFNYVREVQPVFDRHCVSCHDYGGEAGEALNLAADRTLVFSTSYNELWRKGFVKAIGAGPHETQQPYSWGSAVSPLIETLRDGHYGVRLSDEELDRIITWIDINAPYYPSYDSAYPANLAGRSPLDSKQIARLSELTGVAFNKLASCKANEGPQISFDRPKLSRCLAEFKEADPSGYDEAIGIIRDGKKMLAKKPRAEMEGFVAAPIDRRRQDKYAARREVELSNRSAIRDEQKVKD